MKFCFSINEPAARDLYAEPKFWLRKGAVPLTADDEPDFEELGAGMSISVFWEEVEIASLSLPWKGGGFFTYEPWVFGGGEEKLIKKMSYAELEAKLEDFFKAEIAPRLPEWEAECREAVARLMEEEEKIFFFPKILSSEKIIGIEREYNEVIHLKNGVVLESLGDGRACDPKTKRGYVHVSCGTAHAREDVDEFRSLGFICDAWVL